MADWPFGCLHHMPILVGLGLGQSMLNNNGLQFYTEQKYTQLSKKCKNDIQYFNVNIIRTNTLIKFAMILNS